MSYIEQISVAVQGKAVPVEMPEWCKLLVPGDEDSIAPPSRDLSSSWTGFIRYRNEKGEESARRIVCRRVEGYGKAETIGAWCCEKRAHKRFRIDRISELVCLDTGEVLDPIEHFEGMRLRGAINVVDKSLLDLGRILVFMAKCDGEFHPLEQTSIYDTMERYVLRFGGDEHMLHHALKNSGRIAPDGEDFVNSLERLQRHPEAPKLARLILQGVSEVNIADGIYHTAELEWSELVSAALKEMAVA